MVSSTIPLLLVIVFVPLLVTCQSSMVDSKIQECFVDLMHNLSNKTIDQLCNKFRTFIGCVLKKELSKKPTAHEVRRIDEEIKRELARENLHLPCTYDSQDIADDVWSFAFKTSASVFIYIFGISIFLLYKVCFDNMTL